MSVLQRYLSLLKPGWQVVPQAHYPVPHYQAPTADTPLSALSFTVFDMETSGLSEHKHHIVQVASMRIAEHSLDLGSAWSALVNNEGTVHSDSRLIHEIRPVEQRTGHEESQVLQEFVERATASVLLAYDANFDLAFLRKAWRRYGWQQLSVVCLDLSRIATLVLPQWRGQAQGLDDCLRYCGIEPDDQDRHDALGDTFLAASLALVLLSKAQRQGWQTLAELQQALRQQEQMRSVANVSF